MTRATSIYSPIIHDITIKNRTRLGNMYCWYFNPFDMYKNLSIATNRTENTETSDDETIMPARNNKKKMKSNEN